MPWQIYTAGSASNVIEQLKALAPQGQSDSDREQFEAFRDIALKELAALPPAQDVKIDAQGTRTDKQFSINFHLFSRQL